MRRVSLAVNGVRHELDLEPRELLVYVLRERLGLTGTNVGCDTSSCGACTVLLDGESVKSLHAARRPGRRRRADDDRRARPERRAAPDAAGVPRAPRAPVRLLHARAWSWPPVSLLAREPGPERGRRSASGSRATSAAAPATTTSSRQSGCGGGWRRRWQRPSTLRRYVGCAVPRKEDPELLTGQARFVDDLDVAGHGLDGHRAQPLRARADHDVDLAAAREAEGVVAAFTGADLADEWAGALPCAWPVTEDIKQPAHWPLADRQGALRRRRRRVVVAETRALARGRRRARRGRLRAAARGVRRRGRARRRRSDRARRPRQNHCYTWKLEAGRRPTRLFAEAAVTVKERYRQHRLIPNAIEPRGVFVAARPGAGRVHAVVGDPDPAHPPHARSRSSPASPRRSCAIIAPGRRRRLRLEAERLRRGGALPRARAAARPAGQVDRGALGGATSPPSTAATSSRRSSSRRPPTGKITAVRVRLDGGDGRVPPARHAGHPAPRRLALRRLLRRPGATTSTCSGVFTNTTPTDAYRGAGRPEATYAIERAIDALARKLGMDPVEIRRRNFIQRSSRRPSPPASCSTRATTRPRSTRRSSLVGYDAPRPSRPNAASAVTPSSSASASRRTSRCAGSRRRGSSARSATGPAAGTHARSGCCRPGPSRSSPARHRTVRATRPARRSWPTSSASIPTTSRCSTPTPRSSPLGLDTYGAASSRRRRRAVQRRRQGRREGPTIAAHQMEAAEEDLEFVAARSGRGHRPVAPFQELAFAACLAHNLPEDVEPNLTADASTTP